MDQCFGKGTAHFSFDSRVRGKDSSHRTNYFRTNWAKYPTLDLLIIKDDHAGNFHDRWMEDWASPSRAKHLLVFHGVKILTLYSGKGFQSWGKSMRGRGYNIQTWHMDATKCGASLW